jgi:excisionase family DNA binding protein
VVSIIERASPGPGRLSINHVARRLGTHVSTVWRWCESGVRGKRLATVTVGRRTYIREDDLAAFLEAQQRGESAVSRGAVTRGARAKAEAEARGIWVK